MKLSDYLDLTGTSTRAFADRVGLSVSMVSLLRRGKREPSTAVMAKIAHETRGAVMPNDWLEAKGEAPSNAELNAAPKTNGNGHGGSA